MYCDLKDGSIILVQRRDPPRKHAIPGGFVNIGETVEQATIREAKEETNITMTESNLEQFHFYSDPARDMRRHTVSMVFRCLLKDDEADRAIRELHTGDDAKQAVMVPIKDLLDIDLAFDHKKILTEYIRKYSL